MDNSIKVINLFGAPGSGKSVTAAELFAQMKKKGHEVELVTEYAKDLVWSEHHSMFSKQILIFAQQEYRLDRLRGKVEWAITDSPIPLGLLYRPSGYYASYEPLVWEVFKSYNNFNFLLNRGDDIPYNPNGRNEDEAGASVISNNIATLLHDFEIPHSTVDVTDHTSLTIMDQIISNK